MDIPLSILFYKWLLGQEHSLTASDMRFIDPTFAKSIMEMDTIAQRKVFLVSSISPTQSFKKNLT